MVSACVRLGVGSMDGLALGVSRPPILAEFVGRKVVGLSDDGERVGVSLGSAVVGGLDGCDVDGGKEGSPVGESRGCSLG